MIMNVAVPQLMPDGERQGACREPLRCFFHIRSLPLRHWRECTKPARSPKAPSCVEYALPRCTRFLACGVGAVVFDQPAKHHSADKTSFRRSAHVEPQNFRVA